jgi:hypothetical protein
MFAKRASIAQVMLVVAMAAVNFAVMGAVPWDMAVYPTMWIFLGAIDFVIFWSLIARRSLRAFHYTFLIVFVVVCLFMMLLVGTGRVRPLALLIGTSPRPSVLAECWMACLLSLVLAYAIGAVAAWIEKRRGWDIAAFFRGAFVGFGVFMLLAMIADAASDGETWSGARLIGRLLILAVCLILGGRMGLSMMKSSGPDQESRQGQADAASATPPPP